MFFFMRSAHETGVGPEDGAGAGAAAAAALADGFGAGHTGVGGGLVEAALPPSAAAPLPLSRESPVAAGACASSTFAAEPFAPPFRVGNSNKLLGAGAAPLDGLDGLDPAHALKARPVAEAADRADGGSRAFGAPAASADPVARPAAWLAAELPPRPAPLSRSAPCSLLAPQAGVRREAPFCKPS